MRQITVGNGVLVPIDQYLTPINIAYVASGGTVQVSYSDPFPLNAQGYPVATPPTMVWVAAGTSPIVDNPIRAIRITGGSGSDTLTVIQAGVR
jgi:hypothetical protein